MSIAVAVGVVLLVVAFFLKAWNQLDEHPRDFEDLTLPECEEVGLVWDSSGKKFYAYHPPYSSPFWELHYSGAFPLS